MFYIVQRVEGTTWRKTNIYCSTDPWHIAGTAAGPIALVGTLDGKGACGSRTLKAPVKLHVNNSERSHHARRDSHREGKDKILFGHTEVRQLVHDEYIVPSGLIGSLDKCVPQPFLRFVFEDATEMSLLILPCRNNHGGEAALADEP